RPEQGGGGGRDAGVGADPLGEGAGGGGGAAEVGEELEGGPPWGTPSLTNSGEVRSGVPHGGPTGAGGERGERPGAPGGRGGPGVFAALPTFPGGDAVGGAVAGEVQEGSFGRRIERVEFERAHRPGGGRVESRARIACGPHEPRFRPEFADDPRGRRVGGD